MKKLVDSMLEDLSNAEVFLFRICCQSCGEAYANRPVRFSKAGIVPQSEERKILFDAVYDQERKVVRAGAVRSGAEHLNLCPICHRLVCNRCFWICEDLDMCGQCAARLQVQGTPVLLEIPETAT